MATQWRHSGERYRLCRPVDGDDAFDPTRSLVSPAWEDHAFVIAENDRPINGVELMKREHPEFDVSTIDFCNGGDEAVTLRLTLYEHVKYQGDSWSFVFNSNPMSCTRIDRPIVENFNDRMSSWRLHYL